ncbi:MAG: hypothetical protein A07HN63_02352 [uncultured archaeon A07HN63]|nr:MAG: hypothetical protein A07HN63_02352 [uncultured archaeon A07HN63]
MATTGDELAGIVDLFGALTRAELTDALAELAFKQGETVDSDAVGAAIATALADYVLVEYDPPDSGNESESADSLLAVGPAAFPTLPEHGEDLPHILDYEHRTVDRGRLAEQVRERLEAEAEAAIENGASERAAALHDISYDLEAWGSVEVDEIRASLAALLPQD